MPNTRRVSRLFVRSVAHTPRRATWLLALPAAMLGTACASAGSKPAAEDMGGSAVQTAVLRSDAVGSARGMNMVNITEVNRTLVAAPPERTFQALSAAYATLNIPITDINQQARTLGNTAFRTRRRIGDVPTMRALDCGGDSGMPNAETYQLTLTIQSKVVPSDAGGSVILTTVEGTGRNATTSASSDVRCASLGALEKRIGELVKKTLTGD